MAILEPYMEKTYEGVTEAILEPAPGYSIMVHDVQCRFTTTVPQPYVKLICGRRLVGWIRSSVEPDNSLPLDNMYNVQKTILRKLRDDGFVTTYPLPAGFSFKVECPTTAEQIKIIYDLREEPDITPDMINGPLATEWYYFQEGRLEADATETGTYELTRAIAPTEVFPFPFGAPCPAGRQIEVLAIMAMDVEHNYFTTVDNRARTKRLKLIKEETFLFDEDRKGFYLIGAGTVSGTTNTVFLEGINEIGIFRPMAYHPYLKLVQPITVKAGEWLHVQMEIECETADAYLPADAAVCVVFLHIKPL